MAEKEIAIRIKINNQEVKPTSKDIELLTKNIEGLKKELEDMGERTEENAKLFDELKGNIEELESTFEQTKESIGDMNDSMEQQEVQTVSYARELRKTREALAALGDRTEENAEQYDAYANKIIELSDKQEDLQFGTMKLDDALASLPGPIGDAANAFKTYDGIVKNGTAAMRSLTRQFPILKNAIAATGIGALVIILGLLIGAIMKAYESSESLQKVVSGLGDAFGLVMDLIQPLINLLANGLTIAINGVTQAFTFLIGKQDEFNQKLREKEELERFNRELKDMKDNLEIMGDTYDETQKKIIEARIQRDERIKSLNEEEIKDIEEYNRRKLLIDQRFSRDIQRINNEKFDEIQKKRKEDFEKEKKLIDDRLKKQIDAINEETRLLNLQADSIRSAMDMKMSSMSDLLDQQINLRTIQFDRDLIKLEEYLKDTKLTEEESNNIRLSIHQRYIRDVEKLIEDSSLRRIDSEMSLFDSLEKLRNQDLTSQEIFTLETANEYDKLTKFGDVFLGKLSKRMSDEMAIRFGTLNDMREIYKQQLDFVQESIEKETLLLNESREKDLISQEIYEQRLLELREKSIQSRQRYTQQQIQLDQLEIDSKRELFNQTLAIGNGLVQAMGTLFAQSKEMQIGSALLEAAVGIARIITDTQRAIIAFSASVAPLGPVGVGLAASYAVKAKIAAGLAIATITGQAIGKLKSLRGSSDETSSEAPIDNNVSLGRYYERGGVIEGKRHSQGGTMVEAEQGEVIINRNSARMFLPVLSQINQMGGGVAFTQDVKSFNDNPLPSQPQEMIIKTYVVESELTSSINKQARLKNLSTL